MNKVFLAMPYSGTVDLDAFLACSHGACRDPERYRFVSRRSPPGSHCENFNALWCMALNTYQEDGWTHFAMCHSDVIPQEGWLDILLEEMGRVQADLLSVVLPIKDGRGLTSTAIQRRADLYTQRLTMREVHRLPETFDAWHFQTPAAEGSADQTQWDLLTSSGLWLCKTGPWMAEVWFEMRDRIGRLPDGRFVAFNFSEDWGFARQCREQGLRVCATRKVKADHRGGRDWPNDRPWGSWPTDNPTEASYGEWLQQLPGLSSLPENA